jgi:hypothetical protein
VVVLGSEIELNEDDALFIIINGLKDDQRQFSGGYGYDLYLPSLMRNYLLSRGADNIGSQLASLSPVYYAAAWDLCRQGVLRPGIAQYNRQSTEDGSAGNGYSITPFGEVWLREHVQDNYIPTQQGRFAQMLDAFGNQFGVGYRERAQEAIQCYGNHAYFACCAMCGAAAESIILALAISKDGT